MRSEWTKRGLLAALLAVSACAPKGVSNETKAKNEAYLAGVLKEPGAIKDASGLVYKVIKPVAENAPKPPKGATIKINYEGKLTNGVVFDSSYERGVPAVYDLDELVQAWQIAIPMMKKGEVWELYVPAELGYGDVGAGGMIPPGAVLIFKIELIDFMG